MSEKKKDIYRNTVEPCVNTIETRLASTGRKLDDTTKLTTEEISTISDGLIKIGDLDESLIQGTLNDLRSETKSSVSSALTYVKNIFLDKVIDAEVAAKDLAEKALKKADKAKDVAELNAKTLKESAEKKNKVLLEASEFYESALGLVSEFTLDVEVIETNVALFRQFINKPENLEHCVVEKDGKKENVLESYADSLEKYFVEKKNSAELSVEIEGLSDRYKTASKALVDFLNDEEELMDSSDIEELINAVESKNEDLKKISGQMIAGLLRELELIKTGKQLEKAKKDLEKQLEDAKNNEGIDKEKLDVIQQAFEDAYVAVLKFKEGKNEENDVESLIQNLDSIIQEGDEDFSKFGILSLSLGGHLQVIKELREAEKKAEAEKQAHLETKKTVKDFNDVMTDITKKKDAFVKELKTKTPNELKVIYQSLSSGFNEVAVNNFSALLEGDNLGTKIAALAKGVDIALDSESADIVKANFNTLALQLIELAFDKQRADNLQKENEQLKEEVEVAFEKGKEEGEKIAYAEIAEILKKFDPLVYRMQNIVRALYTVTGNTKALNEMIADENNALFQFKLSEESRSDYAAEIAESDALVEDVRYKVMNNPDYGEMQGTGTEGGGFMDKAGKFYGEVKAGASKLAEMLKRQLELELQIERAKKKEDIVSEGQVQESSEDTGEEISEDSEEDEESVEDILESNSGEDEGFEKPVFNHNMKEKIKKRENKRDEKNARLNNLSNVEPGKTTLAKGVVENVLQTQKEVKRDTVVKKADQKSKDMQNNTDAEQTDYTEEGAIFNDQAIDESFAAYSKTVENSEGLSPTDEIFMNLDTILDLDNKDIRYIGKKVKVSDIALFLMPVFKDQYKKGLVDTLLTEMFRHNTKKKEEVLAFMEDIDTYDDLELSAANEAVMNVLNERLKAK